MIKKIVNKFYEMVMSVPELPTTWPKPFRFLLLAIYVPFKMLIGFIIYFFIAIFCILAFVTAYIYATMYIGKFFMFYNCPVINEMCNVKANAINEMLIGNVYVFGLLIITMCCYLLRLLYLGIKHLIKFYKTEFK